MTAWTFTDADREFVARHVESYLPDRIFDAHAHLFCHAHYPPGKLPAHLNDTPSEIGLQVYREHIDWLHPGGRTVGGLFFGLAFQGDRSANDEYVAAEVKAGQAAGFKSLGQMLIAPEMDPELVRDGAPPGLCRFEALSSHGKDRWTHLFGAARRLPERRACAYCSRRRADDHTAHGARPCHGRPTQPGVDPPLLRKISQHAADSGARGPWL